MAEKNRLIKEIEERLDKHYSCAPYYIKSDRNFDLGYDKLKPYGFPIHGCICGYSRRIIWLEVVKSNNDPRITANLYLDAVVTSNGCPMLVRTDCGTENGLIAAMQSSFRANGADIFSGEKSHIYGSSHSNQRIEAWWSFLRRNRSGYWIDFFKDLVGETTLQLGNILHMECLWFCFSSLLQLDLDKVKDHWNSHYIRKSRYDTVSGIPDILYFLPEYNGKQDCLCPVDAEVVEEMKTQCEIENEQSSTYIDYFEYIMDELDLHPPTNENEALDLFRQFIALQE